MIIGIGIDIIEIKRVQRIITLTDSFIQKYFTIEEIKYFNSHKLRGTVIAGNFAAKEAISKALGTGIINFDLTDIEILYDKSSGKPYVNIKEKIYKIIGKRNVKIHITISNSSENAIAYAILEET